MSNIYRRFGTLVMLLAGSLCAYAQSTVSGTVKDQAGDPVPGANIVVVGTVLGTISDPEGKFSLTVKSSPPFTIRISFVGYATQEIEVKEATTTLEVTLEEGNILSQDVVVTATRVEETVLRAPVTIEKVDLMTIKQSTAPDYYDVLQNVKGVQVNQGSMNLTSVNTRGFATIANVRFVQLIDGMDGSAPLLNFPTGNLVGIGELDIESMELQPGAASALYGPNAFNGILLMTSKSPFEYQGLSAQVKVGISTSDAQSNPGAIALYDEVNPMAQYSIRYAKAFNNRFAFKVNFTYMDATDWISNDYIADRNNPESTVDLSGNANFDGMNLYGDETPIPVPIGGTFGTLDLRRTGFREEDIMDNYDANSIKGDVALHYRITDNLEALYSYRYGGGSSVYQGTEKYALRNFNLQFHKLELKSKNFFVRGYMTEEDDGDSYNLSALGGYMNEEISPTAAQWAPTYAQTYVLSMQGYFPGIPAGNPEEAHNFARQIADGSRPASGSPEFKALADKVRTQLFQRTPPGASFYANSRLLHGEFMYNFSKLVDWADIQVGGNFRQYNLFSDGTIFNEAPDDGVNFERILISEFGGYAQIAKTFAESLRITASMRYDKNENFDGQVTPRVSALYSINDKNHIRASFQTGFRNPDTQAQFIYFPSSSGTLLGSTEANASRYGVHNGGAYTEESYLAFRGSGGTLATDGTPTGGNSSLLVTADIPYVQPEKLTAYELGYKMGGQNFFVDLNGYYSQYTDFIGGQIVILKNPTTHQGVAVNPGARYSLYNNSTEDVTSYGAGVGLGYSLPWKKLVVNGSYNYAKYDANETADFRAGFNTPENKFAVGLSSREVIKNLGFALNFRYQQEFLWQSSYGIWNVPEFGVFDAQINYKISSLKSVVKIGGTNIGGGDYRTNIGAPFIGSTYYISLTFDQFTK